MDKRGSASSNSLLAEFRRWLSKPAQEGNQHAISALELPDEDLQRFLVARTGDFEEARDLVIRSQKWRNEEWKLDELVNEDFSDIDRRGELFFSGKAIDGSQVMWYRVALHDPKAFAPEIFSRYVIWKLERFLRTNEEVKYFTIVFDRTNATRANVDTALWKVLVPILKDYYPERMCKTIVGPTQAWFWVLYQMFQYFIDKRTRDKVVFGGRDLLDTLEKHVTRDNWADHLLPPEERVALDDGDMAYSPSATPLGNQ